MADENYIHRSISPSQDDRFVPNGSFENQQRHDDFMSLRGNHYEAKKQQRTSRSSQIHTNSIVRSRSASVQHESSIDQPRLNDRSSQQNRADLNFQRPEEVNTTGGAAIFNDHSTYVQLVNDSDVRPFESMPDIRKDSERFKKLVEQKLCKPKIRLLLDLPMFDHPIDINVDSNSTLNEPRAVLFESWPILRLNRLIFLRDDGQGIERADECFSVAELDLHSKVLKLRYNPENH